MDLLQLPSDTMVLIERSKNGVTKQELKELQQETRLTNEQLSSIVGLTPRALQNYKMDSLLKLSVSERAIALAQLYAHGFDVFGEERFFRWMNREHVALGRRKPIDLLDTHFGITLIGDEIGRIEHGVLA